MTWNVFSHMRIFIIVFIVMFVGYMKNRMNVIGKLLFYFCAHVVVLYANTQVQCSLFLSLIEFECFLFKSPFILFPSRIAVTQKNKIICKYVHTCILGVRCNHWFLNVWVFIYSFQVKVKTEVRFLLTCFHNFLHPHLHQNFGSHEVGPRLGYDLSW